MNIYDQQCAELLRNARKNSRKNQGDVAREMNIKYPVFISLLESGKSRLPTKRISEYCDIVGASKKKVVKLLVKSYEFRLKQEAGY